MILLDTNALIWLEQDHPRSRPLSGAKRLYISPASLLELRFLEEAGRIQLRNATLAELVQHDLWLLDDPPSAAWFEHAWEISWTRDPFDRLIVAHARMRRWKLATGDSRVLNGLSERERLAL
jgi:PIN domain nuclease of toxin-antitoxin system